MLAESIDECWNANDWIRYTKALCNHLKDVMSLGETRTIITYVDENAKEGFIASYRAGLLRHRKSKESGK